MTTSPSTLVNKSEPRTPRRPTSPRCSFCDKRHKTATEYNACERVHAAAQAIIVAQVERARSGDTANLPADVKFYVAEMEDKERNRTELRAQGIINPETLPAVTSEQMDGYTGVVDPDDEFGVAGRRLLLAQDRWCWFEGRAWSRKDLVLAKKLRAL